VTKPDDQLITSIEQLETIYHDPVKTSLLKELDHITDDYRQFIDASPFVVLATAGPDGLDCSPRGDPAGFVRIVDSHTVMIPDRRGNNRVDSLRNIVRDPRVALLFLIPGVNETMRINGHAVLSTDPELCESFAMGEKVPACVIVITVDRIYPQCPKALIRSKLWDPSMHVPRSALPTTGQMLERITEGAYDGAAHDAAYPERVRQTIY
jgi:PPOX class probable FMN-dependent enzyme